MKWKRLNDKKKNDAAGDSANVAASDKNAAAPDSTKLELSSRLKEVLCTNLCLSAEDAQKLIDQASGN